MLVDILHLSRNLRRSPASAVAAVLTLSLTLGAGASIFAVVDAILLTPPPFKQPDALVQLGETPLDDPGAVPRTVGYATFEAWRERSGALATLEASDGTNLTLTDLGPAERVSAVNVTPGFLTLLGVGPAIGRGFESGDVARPVAIISDNFWRGKLDADPRVVGRQIVLGGESHTVVGVLPEQFVFAADRIDIWRPFPVTPAQAVRSGYRVGVVARLAGDVTPTLLAATLDDVSRASSPAARVVATSIATAAAGAAAKPLRLLAGAAVLAVLIAFTNLAGLIVVRSIDRRRELAVRSALGARGSEIARQLLLEAEALVAMGTLGGVLLAMWLTPVVGRLALEQFGGVASRDVAMSGRVIVGVATVAAVAAAICGLLPALLVARRGVLDVLRRGATPPSGDVNLRRVFVAGEVALAFVLLVSLTLVGRSLLNVLKVNPGFDAHGVLILKVALPAARYPDLERVVSFYSTLQSALEARLGPRAVAVIDEIPLTHDRGRTVVRVAATDPEGEAVVREATSSYFDVMRIPLLAGQSFDVRDNSSAPRRIVLSESLAARLFGAESPIGRQIRLGATAQAAEVIGVVGDVKHRALDDLASPTIYRSGWQADSRGRIVVVRSVRPTSDVIDAVREEVARLDRDLPVYGRQSMAAVVAASPGVPARRVLTATFTGFAVLAVVLAGIGLFGVAAHDVSSRRGELALRIALGAEPRRIVSGTVRRSALMVGSGLVVGGVLSIWVTRALGGLVFATGQLDAVNVGVPAAILTAVGAAAVFPAARRAARTDPVIALRSD